MGSADIPALVSQLGSDVVIERQKARLALEAAGEAAAEALVGALDDPHKEVRWEAAKALVKVGSPRAAKRLAAMLDEDDAGNRWVAAEALMRLGRDGVIAVLEVVSGKPSIPMRLGAHHVLHDIADEEIRTVVRPVCVAIESASAAEQTPVAALAALRALGAIA